MSTRETAKPVVAPYTLAFVATPMSLLWLFLDNDMWAKVGYVALVIAVSVDWLRATHQPRKG